MTIEEQLKQFIKDRYGSVRAFALKHNFPYSSVANIFSRGIGTLGLQAAANICDCLNIDIDGLARGIICLRGDISKCIPVAQSELRLITAFRAAGKETQQQILDALPDKPLGNFVPTGVVVAESILNSLSQEEINLVAAYRTASDDDRAIIDITVNRYTQSSTQAEKHA